MDRSYQRIYVKRYHRTNIIYIFTLIAIMAGLASLPFINVDVTSQSRGTLRPSDDPIVINSPRSGFVLHSNLHDGSEVCVGDTLFVLSREILTEQENQINEQIQRLTGELHDLNQIIESGGKATRVTQPKYISQVVAFQQQGQDLSLEVEYLKHRDSINNLLYEEGVIAARTFDEGHLQFRRAKERLDLHRERQMVQWQDLKYRLKLEARDLYHRRSQLVKEKKDFVYCAPHAGILSGLQGMSTGSFASQGQTLGQIVPKGDLVVELAVHPKDIGLVKVGQEVLFHIDAFNYREWGMASGKVSSIHDVAQISEATYFFKVRCDIRETHLKLKSGFMGHLQQGMTLTGRIVLTRRTLFQLLFDQVDDWFNPFVELHR